MIKRRKIKRKIFDLLPYLKDFLKNEEDIVFAYIFGSYGRGRVSPLSDVDIAIYLKGGKDLFDRKLKLVSQISKILETDEIDLVILNEASPSLIHSIFKSGKLLFSRDEPERISFFAKNLKEYMEFSYYRERFHKAMSRRIKEGRFGQ